MTSQSFQIRKWDHPEVPLSEASVRDQHSPAEDFRISVYRRKAGTRYLQSTENGIVYVLSGSCSWYQDGNAVAAVAGDILDLPKGKYVFKVLEDEPCEIIHVWNLKELVLESD